MCAPLAPLAVPLLIAGTVTGGVGAYMTSTATNKAISYNQQVMEQNAQDALQRGHSNEAKVWQRVSLLQGQQRSSAGASGALIDSGSLTDVNTETQFLAEQDALTTKYNAELEARGYRQQSNLLGLQRQNILFNTGTSVLSSLSPLALKYTK